MTGNHCLLNDLCRRLDPTRCTTMAHAFMLDSSDPFVFLPDIRSYNLYYGWYVGDWEQNDAWFDDFHAKHPDTVIGLSEYGADANPQYQAAHPEKGDWTEGYQALYHEHKTKKDAFYLYKAYLSDEPFVHLCGRRYADRTEDKTEIKVYSNQESVTLYVDGEKVAEHTGDKIFTFGLSLTGTHEIRAVSGDLTDEMTIRHVDTQNSDYVKDGASIVNWFDRDDEIVREGYFSIKDSMGDVKASPEAQAVLNEMMEPLQAKILEAYGDVAKNVQMPPEMQAMMDRMSVEASLKQMGRLVTPEFVHKLNHALNQIKK